MHLHRDDQDHMELGEMDFLCSQFILQIVPNATATDNSVAANRLLGTPTQGREPDFEQDWKDYVHPDLRNIFRSAQKIVEGDLKRFRPPEAG